MISGTPNSPTTLYHHRPNMLDLMAETSKKLTQSIGAICADMTVELNEASLCTFGSHARNEMLPTSDVDYFIISSQKTPHDNTDKSRIYDTLATLPYDKVDSPDDILDIGSFSDNVTIGSPESFMADCRIINKEFSSPLHEKIINKARDSLHSSNLLAENLVFNYFFSAHQETEKAKDGYVNIKYCNGGSRDMLFFDRAADYFSGSQVSIASSATGRPQIELSMPFLANFFGMTSKITPLLEAANYVIAIKHYAMSLKNTHNLPYDGTLSPNTASNIVQHYFPGMDPAELIKQFSEARVNLTRLKDFIFKKLIDNIPENNTALGDLIAIWQAQANAPSKQQMQQLALSDRWTILASLMCNKHTDSGIIDAVIRRTHSDQRYSYINRLIAKHPRTSRKNLLMLIQSKNFSPDIETNNRYLALTTERIQQKEQ